MALYEQCRATPAAITITELYVWWKYLIGKNTSFRVDNTNIHWICLIWLPQIWFRKKAMSLGMNFSQTGSYLIYSCLLFFINLMQSVPNGNSFAHAHAPRWSCTVYCVYGLRLRLSWCGTITGSHSRCDVCFHKTTLLLNLGPKF